MKLNLADLGVNIFTRNFRSKGAQPEDKISTMNLNCAHLKLDTTSNFMNQCESLIDDVTFDLYILPFPFQVWLNKSEARPHKKPYFICICNNVTRIVSKVIELNPLTNNQSHCEQRQSPEENLELQHHVLRDAFCIVNSVSPTRGHSSSFSWLLKRVQKMERRLTEVYVESSQTKDFASRTLQTNNVRS